MNDSNSWLVLAGLVVTFLTALIGWWSTRSKIQQVHVLVNSQLKTVLDRVDQLTGTLHGAGIEIPPAPAGPPPPPSPPAPRGTGTVH